MKYFALGCLLTCSALGADVYTAKPIATSDYTAFPYSVTGRLTAPTKVGGMLSLGSGAVVQSPRVVFSCAHVVFDGYSLDPWLTGVTWYRDSSGLTGNGQAMRGYYYFSGYASAARAVENSPLSFAQDFVVHYAYENTANGNYAGYHEDGAAQLQSTKLKLITGYPSGNYISGDTRKYLMHSTGPFTLPFSVELGDYLTIQNVSTGSGNSGGPIWVHDGNFYKFAGVLVSGLERSNGDRIDLSGVYAVDQSSLGLINAAITASGVPAATLPVITSQPTSRRVLVGETASFTVTASGTNLTYRWLYNSVAINNVNSVAVSNAQSSSLTLSSVTQAQAGTYQVAISNAAGEVRSTPVTLFVDEPAPTRPAITSSPSNQVVRAGETATLRVTATGTSPSYQWYVGTSGDISSPLATATGTTLVSPTLFRTTSFWVRVSNAAGNADSTTSVVTVTQATQITQPPTVTSTQSGYSASLLATASGAGLSYQWYQGSSGVTSRPIVGATSANFNTPYGTQSTDYWVRVTGSGGTADSASVGVTPPQTGRGLVNMSVRVAAGDSPIIPGLVVDSPIRALIRVAGPALSQFGVRTVLPNPKLVFYSGNSVLGENDDWGSNSTSVLEAGTKTGAFAFPAGSKDAAMVLDLPAGTYTCVISGEPGTSGEVLLEVYRVPN